MQQWHCFRMYADEMTRDRFQAATYYETIGYYPDEGAASRALTAAIRADRRRTRGPLVDTGGGYYARPHNGSTGVAYFMQRQMVPDSQRLE